MTTMFPAWATGPGPVPPPPHPPPPPPPPPPRRRAGRRLAALAVAAAVALGGVLVWQSTAGTGPAAPQLTTAQVSRRVSPALVDIVSVLGYQQAESAGTGIVLQPSGEVLTNNHVIEGATAIRVTDVGNGRTYPARVVGYDRGRDVAVLQLSGAAGLATATLGNSASVRVGDRVVALGNAGGQGGAPSVVTGRVLRLGAAITASDQSAGTSERLTGLIGHDAPIQPGDSGGPLVDTAGRVIGINTAASSGYQFSGGQAQVRAFAIPVNQAMAIARRIEAGRAGAGIHLGKTAFLGVGIMSAAQAQAQGVPPGSGAAVAGVLPGTPAAGAGIAAGDVITSVGGVRVTSPEALQAALERHHPGDRVTVGWTSQFGQPRSATVILAVGPAG